MSPPFAIKAEVHREDDRDLAAVEATGAAAVHDALQDQLAALRGVRGANSVDEIMAVIEAALVANGGLLLALTKLLEGVRPLAHKWQWTV
ncbi:MAG: hypothetical protein HC804_04090 [Anaerolineae bacterium]|nr:hypothetical protein [Anaerolineae bacterium]